MTSEVFVFLLMVFILVSTFALVWNLLVLAFLVLRWLYEGVREWFWNRRLPWLP